MYGRARRIELVKKIVITIVALIGVILIARFVIGLLLKKENNVAFAELKRYLSGKGYACESLKNSGAACKIRSDTVTERFIRYDKGFDYLYNNGSYIVEIYHLDGESKILFNTGDASFADYKNLRYICSFKENILNELDKCVLEDDPDEKLDNEAYIGIINKKIYEVNMIIEASKYNKKDLLENYQWNRK